MVAGVASELVAWAWTPEAGRWRQHAVAVRGGEDGGDMDGDRRSGARSFVRRRGRGDVGRGSAMRATQERQEASDGGDRPLGAE